VNQSVFEQVWARAQGRCEYCRISHPRYRLPFQIDHILARQHGGDARLENLALACFHCNRYKGPNIASWDAGSNQLTRLFNPRADEWAEHFLLVDVRIVGLTPVGRVTTSLLNMNSPNQMLLRGELLDEETHER